MQAAAPGNARAAANRGRLTTEKGQIDPFQSGQSDQVVSSGQVDHLLGSIDQIDPLNESSLDQIDTGSSKDQIDPCLAVQLDQIDPVVSG